MSRMRWRPSRRLLRAFAAVLAAAAALWVGITDLWPRFLCLDPARFPPNPLVHPLTVADLLAHPPSPDRSVEVDAYFSGAASPPGTARAASQGGAVDRHAILSDLPFLPDLLVLGDAQPNVLPHDAPWLVLDTAPGTPALAGLPYRARFRGRLGSPASGKEGGAAGRVFTLERVVRVYAQEPPTPQAAADPATWPRYWDGQARYAVPQPPEWRVDRASVTTLALSDPRHPRSPITIRVHQGETHDDPYDPAAAPPLLKGEKWTHFRTAQGLYGYRIDREEAGERTVAVLLSGRGHTYELTVTYALGFAAPQPVLTNFSAIVAGFRFDEPPGPTPTPPVRQTLGGGPFLDEQEALERACNCLEGEIDDYAARLLSEAEARRLASRPTAFYGHYDGIWVMNVDTPRAARTQKMRLFFDAVTGRELWREEMDQGVPPLPTPTPTPDADSLLARTRRGKGRAARWIEVILAQQTVIAWEGEVPVRRMLASTGTARYPTVRGTFRVYLKYVSAPMRGPDYYLPNVPHIMYFYLGYALHGAYWHTSFGTPMSHGCVNLSLADAAWLFDWASPQVPAGSWAVRATPCNPGTLVVVH